MSMQMFRVGSKKLLLARGLAALAALVSVAGCGGALPDDDEGTVQVESSLSPAYYRSFWWSESLYTGKSLELTSDKAPVDIVGLVGVKDVAGCTLTVSARFETESYPGWGGHEATSRLTYQGNVLDERTFNPRGGIKDLKLTPSESAPQLFLSAVDENFRLASVGIDARCGGVDRNVTVNVHKTTTTHLELLSAADKAKVAGCQIVSGPRFVGNAPNGKPADKWGAAPYYSVKVLLDGEELGWEDFSVEKAGGLECWAGDACSAHKGPWFFSNSPSLAIAPKNIPIHVHSVDLGLICPM